MNSRIERTCDTVGNILQVTKNTIQLSDNYYDYYINKDNALYRKQLPLLVQKSNMLAIAIKRKEDEKNYLTTYQNKNNSDSLDKLKLPLSDIRNAQIRSKKLPPLCPFYSNKGELLRSVVTTSKVFNKQYLTDNKIASPSNKIKLLKINIKKKDDNNPLYQTSTINFDDFQNDYFYEPEYSSLTYKDFEIFGKRDYYFDYINNIISKFKSDIISDNEFKKEKIFEKNKQRKNVSLSFNSISVKIFEIKNEPKEDEKINERIKKKKEEEPIFEYNLPFVYLPLFYVKGEEKFKIFLSKIIQWDNTNNKFILCENPEKIFQDILKNCADFNKKEKKEEKKELKNSEDSNKGGKNKFSLTMGGKKMGKKDGGLKFNSFSSSMIDEKSLAQSMIAPKANTYLTNLDDSKRKFDIIYQESIYPCKKEYNYINYNIFEFLWITPKKNFKVCISTPLAIITIPRNKIQVKKFIDFEILFYLYEKNFKNWDFYLIRYISSFKSFRTLLEEINSINESSNKDFYLTQPRIKNYSFNNTKMINIASIKQKSVLDNLIEGFMGIPEDKKEEEQKDEKKKGKETEKETEKEKEKIENSEKEKEKEENKEEVYKEKENEAKTDEENKKEELKNQENFKEINQEKKEEKEKVEENNNINNENEDLINTTFIQKCFIAIIRFADIKTSKANEYKIYFNFNQFQKFQKMEKYVDKISFLIKFIDINYKKKSVSMNYKSLDHFDEKKWIKEFNQYNTQYLHTLENKTSSINDVHRMAAEYLGMAKNSIIQIEIYTPISLARTLSEIGLIKTDKILMSNNYQDKAVDVEKDNILEMSKIFYDSYEEEQNKKA